MKIALIQWNTVVGDIAGIRTRLLEECDSAEAKGFDVIVFPELATTGYPPKDLLLKRDFIDDSFNTVAAVTEWTLGKHLVVVLPYADRCIGNGSRPLANAVAALSNGIEVSNHWKTLLPNYDVFDEDRYFERGDRTSRNFYPFMVDGELCGMLICEEVWNDLDEQSHHLYDFDPVKFMAKQGVKHIFIPNASPFRLHVAERRLSMLRKHAKDKGVNLYYCNQVGGHDEVVFDGGSLAINSNGDLIGFGPYFEEQMVGVSTKMPAMRDEYVSINWVDSINAAVPLAIRDYRNKQHIAGPLLVNVSGGIDSALALYYAVRAVGPENVLAFSQPSEFSSEGSKVDAFALCKTLGVAYDEIPIGEIHQTFRSVMDDSIRRMCDKCGDEFMETKGLRFHQKDEIKLCSVPFFQTGVPDENLQPRIRGLIIMAWANLLNGLVIATGNKSEMAVGYCTLYGDMAGGFNALKDVPKTSVFMCCQRINELAKAEIIPWNTIEKQPSAELRADQKDSDSLPPYPVLDEVIRRYADNDEEAKYIIQMMTRDTQILNEAGWDETYPPGAEVNVDAAKQVTTWVKWTCAQIDRMEYKRRQAPLGVKITSRDMARGRQVPVVQAWTGNWQSGFTGTD